MYTSLKVSGVILRGDINEIITAQTVISRVMFYRTGRSMKLNYLTEANVNYLIHDDPMEDAVALSMISLSGTRAIISSHCNTGIDRNRATHMDFRFFISDEQDHPSFVELTKWLSPHKGRYLYIA